MRPVETTSKRAGRTRNPPAPQRASRSAQQRLGEGADDRTDIVACKREREIGLDIARLVAAIVALAIEGKAVERLVADQLRHRVGQLDLAAGALFLPFEDAHDFGLEDVAARDHQVRW